jgi:hypothetical protein
MGSRKDGERRAFRESRGEAGCDSQAEKREIEMQRVSAWL